MRALILLLFGSTAVLAQPFTAGIKAGIPLTDFLNAAGNGMFDYTAPMQHYIVGGVAELRLPKGFGIEVDALYRRLQYTGSGNLVDVFVTSHTSGSNWEFPVLLKYRFHFPIVKPYVDAGVAWDTLAGLKQTVTSVSLAPPGSSPQELLRNTTMGFVIGGGIDIHAVVMHISPELRFTRWSSAQIGNSGGLLNSNLNQAEFLVGFTF